MQYKMKYKHALVIIVTHLIYNCWLAPSERLFLTSLVFILPIFLKDKELLYTPAMNTEGWCTCILLYQAEFPL